MSRTDNFGISVPFFIFNLAFLLTLFSLAFWRGIIRPVAGVNLPAPVFFPKTKNDINFKLCMVVVFYISFQKIKFIVSCRWLFWWRHHSYYMSHDFLCFSTFSRNIKCFHFKNVLKFFLWQICHFEITITFIKVLIKYLLQ